jgi:hypothetical protein
VAAAESEEKGEAEAENVEKRVTKRRINFWYQFSCGLSMELLDPSERIRKP